MDELKQRADCLKEHIKTQKKGVSEKFDRFVNEVLTTETYDHLLDSDAVLELQKLFNIQFKAESPIRTSFQEMFDPRDEIEVKIPLQRGERNRDKPQEEIKVVIPC